MVKVKICGIKEETALEAALAAGASACGFMLVETSKRNITPEQAGALARAVPASVLSVAVVANASDTFLQNVMAVVKPDMIQAHGEETPERIAEIAAFAPVLKVVQVKREEDIARAQSFSAAKGILFDAGKGEGKTFPWDWLQGRQFPFCWGLAGGLAPDNVAAAIHQTLAAFVDVSTGVENASGEKDPALIAEFIARARQTGA